VTSRAPVTPRRLAGWSAALGAGLLLCLVVAAGSGAGAPDLGDLLSGELSPLAETILLRVRLPRVLAAAIIGGALSVAGVAFQGLLRNPLADPYILGVSGGASIGGVVAMLLGLGGATAPLAGLGVEALAFLGALGALLLIERIATVGGSLTVYTLILTGAVFNAFSGALILFLQSVASFEQLHSIVFYLMGQVPASGYPQIALLAATVGAGTVAVFAMARDYNALSLGEEGAASVGVDVERVKRRTFALGALLTGLCVAFAGLIGFVGLIVPHVLRLLLGPDHRLLLPLALLGGGAFLVLADLLSRTLVAPNEIPVGVVTALAGGPFFLYLLRRRGREHGGG
jgi:iron complex transport system permease protein